MFVLFGINIFVANFKIKLNNSFLKSDQNGKKSKILKLDVIDREEFVIVSKKETFSLEQIELAIDVSQHPLIVYSDEREALLKHFIYLWKRRKSEHKAGGVRNLAKLLCAFIDFRSAENEEVTVSSLTIEKELFILKEKSR